MTFIQSNGSTEIDYMTTCQLYNVTFNNISVIHVFVMTLYMKKNHAGHTRKASRISKTVVDNCSKGVGNFYLS